MPTSGLLLFLAELRIWTFWISSQLPDADFSCGILLVADGLVCDVSFLLSVFAFCGLSVRLISLAIYIWWCLSFFRLCGTALVLFGGLYAGEIFHSHPFVELRLGCVLQL